MNDSRLDATTGDALKKRGAHPEMSADLEALRRDRDRDLPSLESFVRPAARRQRTWEDVLMAASETLTHRPWGIAALAGALAVIALLVVPFSYERTTGHTVTLALSGNGLNAESVRGIALQMKALTHAQGVAVQAEDSNGALAFTLTSTVPNGTGIDAAATAAAFGAELKRLGYTAAATVAPVKERVSGTVYAYARDNVIKVDIQGKTAAQIESEIRQGLADAGVTNAQVSVSTEGSGDDHKLKLTVEAKKQIEGPGSHEASQPMPKLELSKGGAPLGDAHGFSVREELRRSPDGTTLTILVQDSGKNASIEVPHVDTMTDAAITAQVESQLRAAGIEATVTTTNGRVMLEKH